MEKFFEDIAHEFSLPLENPVPIFSLILFIILISPILLRKINIPGIIGLILSGVIIGPYGLGVLEQTSAVELFSTIGLLYIMFIAGLELDMNDFRKNKHKSVLFGLFTFTVPLAIGFPTCYYLLGYDFNASFLTASMFATHTLVSYPVVSKFGIAKNQAVAITVGGTILTDTAVLIILAVIVGSAAGGLNNEFWIRLGISLALFSAFMFLVIPKVAKWFFRKLESEKHSHYVFVLFVVFLAAFLAELAGVEPIIGAFVAGLALNRLIPHTSALMNRIEFIGNSIFIPFFLISVGMLVDLSVILKGPMALIVAGTLTIAALGSKWVAAFFTRLAFKYSPAQQNLIFGLSSAHAAATLAVILVGYNAEILDENILNGTIILILITCVVASLVTEKAAKQIILNAEDEEVLETTAGGGINEHILLPIANFENMEKLIDFATMIRDKKSTHPITLLSVVPNDEEAEKNILKARRKLDTIVQHASASETEVNFIATIDHNVSSGIARTSREIMSDIVIQGWPRRKRMLDKLLGERSENILNSTDKTVFACHLDMAMVAHKRIIVCSFPLAEMETGFPLWLSKTAKLAQELGISIVHFCNKRTEEAIDKLAQRLKLSAEMTFQEFNQWNDFVNLTEQMDPDDMIVLVSARKGGVSYQSVLDNLPEKLERKFEQNSRVIIFPNQQGFSEFGDIEYNTFGSKSLARGINSTLHQVGKELGNMFGKEEKGRK